MESLGENYLEVYGRIYIDPQESDGRIEAVILDKKKTNAYWEQYAIDNQEDLCQEWEEVEDQRARALWSDWARRGLKVI